MTARALIALSSALVLSLAAAAPAFSHSFPVEENPAAGQALSAAPSSVSIKYDAPIEQLFATLQVIGPDGSNLAGQPVVSSDGYLLTVKLPALKPGSYMVKWGVVCVDTHHTQGSYSFTVGS